MWYFGQNAGIDFNGGSATALSNGTMSTEYGCASIADRNTGALLFYTDGDTVWDASHNIMANGSSIGGHAANFQSAFIVPFPQDPDKYYIFATGPALTGYGLYYATVDMTLNGGLGAVVLSNQIVYNDAMPHIAAAKHANGTDFWLISHQMNSDSFYVHPITAAGIGAPVINEISWFQSAPPWGHVLKASPDGSKLAFTHNFHALSIFDFDNATGIISNEIQNVTGFTSGVAFSSNSSKLYMAAQPGLMQFDLSSGDSATIASSWVSLGLLDFEATSVQLGPDSRVYVAVKDSAHLNVVEFPNNLSPSVGYVEGGFVLTGGALSKYGLPAMLECEFTACDVDAGPNILACQTAAQLNAAPASAGNYNYSWSPVTGLSDPNIYNPTVTHADSMWYTVTIADSSGCIASDSVLVTAQNPVFDTLWICSSDSVLVDLGPGAMQYDWLGFTDAQGNNSAVIPNNVQSLWATEPGQYFAVAYYQQCGALTSLIPIAFDPNCGPCTVDAGPDTIACQSSAQLNATALTAGGVFSYSWSPTIGLDDPNIQNPSATGVDSVMYTVTMTGNDGCIAIDSVLVSSYVPVFDTIVMCDSVLLDLGPGAFQYDWQNFMDTAGNSTVIGANTQTLWADEPGEYLAIAFYPSCGALTSVFIVSSDPACDSLPVFPGDCNNDGIANNIDYLYVGLAHNFTGSPRATNSITWNPHNALPWAGVFPTSGINNVYADANGNGTVENSDTTAILTNYNQTHGVPPTVIDSSNANHPELYFVFSNDSIMASDTLQIDVFLGKPSQQLTNFYGIAFTIDYDTAIIEPNGVSMEFLQTSWLGVDGVDALSMTRDNWNKHRIDAAYTRINHAGTNGFGQIATMEVVMQDDISGKATLITEMINFEAKEIVSYTPTEEPITIRGYQDSVLVFMNDVSIDNNATPVNQLTLYPVPADNYVIVQSSNADIEQVALFNLTGQQVQVGQTNINTRQTRLDVSTLSSGIYLVKASFNGKESWQKLQVK